MELFNRIKKRIEENLVDTDSQTGAYYITFHVRHRVNTIPLRINLYRQSALSYDITHPSLTSTHYVYSGLVVNGSLSIPLSLTDDQLKELHNLMSTKFNNQVKENEELYFSLI